MFAVVWISFAGLFYSGTGLGHQARHERTRYVSSRNQIYGENFDVDEKYIPFVHFWEKPLQVLESSMKIPKKLSARPLFSWDLPVPRSTYTPSKKTSTTENPNKVIASTEADNNAVEFLSKVVQNSRSDTGRASVLYPDMVIPAKTKKSWNRKKSIQEWKEFTRGRKTSVTIDSSGRSRKKKKLRKSRKGKSEKTGKRKKIPPTGKEMNDAVIVSVGGERRLEAMLEVQSLCEASEKKCEHRCEEANGKATCVCFKGYTLQGGGRCADINECETNKGGCNGKCMNTIGSRKCMCSSGFRLVDSVCADVNECLLRNGHGPCQDQCVNTLGSYYCTCDNLAGTTLSSNKHTCEDAQACNATTAGCSHSCINLSGLAFCTCPDGLELGDDWKTCHDIDECLNPEDYDVRCEFRCINTIGSYTCAAEMDENTV